MQSAENRLRIVSWNCAGCFRDKFALLAGLHADILIVQECENPATCSHEAYKEFAANHVWVGDLPYKGLGVFAREGLELSVLPWESYCLRHFLPVRVNDAWNLLAVWAGRPYIEEYYVYHAIHRDKIDEQTLIMGDFNSNQRWDRKHGARSHSAVVRMMAEAGLASAWHHTHGEPQGSESEPTFYLYRKPERPYHIDYAFAAPARIVACQIVHDPIFACSDHRPLVLDLAW